MKNYFASMLCLVATVALLLLSGCPGSVEQPATTTCSEVGSDFNQLVNGLFAKKTATEKISWDLPTHFYTFSVSANRKVCKIGYKGNAALFTNNKPYKIEINDAAGASVYAGNHLFKSNTIDYQSITPITLLAGKTYTIKRTVVGYTNSSQVEGMIITFNSNNNINNFPISQGALTITQAGFSGGGAPINNYGIPFINMVFE